MDLTVWQVLVLAVVQGVAEFLPISSDGHVVVVAALITSDPEHLEVFDLNIAMHLGTLISILVVYAQRIVDLLRHDRRLIGPLIVATIPAGIIGVGLKKQDWFDLDQLLSNPLLAGFGLVFTGLVLLSTRRLIVRQTGKQVPTEIHDNDNKSVTNDHPPSGADVSYGAAVAMGFAQALAILPGVSRSGSTIATALTAGINSRLAATFSISDGDSRDCGGGIVADNFLRLGIGIRIDAQNSRQLAVVGRGGGVCCGDLFRCAGSFVG